MSSPWSGVRNFSYHRLPQSSHVVSSISSAVDVASCRLEETIVPATTAVTSPCYTMVTWPSNITDSRNLELDTLSDVKSMGKYWLNFGVLTSRDKKIKLCSYVIRSTGSPSGSQRSPGWPQVSPAAADSPRNIWWTVSRNNTVLLLYRQVTTSGREPVVNITKAK